MRITPYFASTTKSPKLPHSKTPHLIPNPNLLLTGATGFLGAAVATELARRGTPFCALVRKSADVRDLEKLRDAPDGPAVELATGDVNDPDSLLDAMRGVGVVIHAAALVSFQARDRDRMLLVNGEGTANVVNMALEAGVGHLVHVSSVAALNRRPGEVTTLKDHWPETRPATAYAESKFAAEREALRGRAEGLSVSIVYPSTILGVGDFNGRNTPGLWRTVAGGLRAYPSGTAGFVALQDVVDVLLHHAEQREDGARHLLNADNLSWRDFFTLVAESLGVPPPTFGLTAWQSRLAWPLEGLRARLTGTRPRLTRERALTAAQRYAYAGTALEPLLGRTYTPIPAVVEEISAAYLAHEH